MFRLILLFTFVTTLAIGQDFVSVPYDTLLVKQDSAGYDLLEAGRMDGYTYHVRCRILNDSVSEVQRLLIYDRNDSLIFKSMALLESHTYRLRFFKSTQLPDVTILLAHYSLQHSLGNDVYTIENGVVRHLGLLDIGTYNVEDIPGDIADFLNISVEDGAVIFRFVPAEVVFNPGGPARRTLRNEQIQYEYSHREWREMTIYE